MREAEFNEQTALAMRRIETWPLSVRRNFRVSDPEGIPYRPDPALRGSGIWIIECDAGGHTLCGDCVVYWDLAWNWDATELDRCVTYADGLRVARALMA